MSVPLFDHHQVAAAARTAHAAGEPMRAVVARVIDCTPRQATGAIKSARRAGHHVPHATDPHPTTQDANTSIDTDDLEAIAAYLERHTDPNPLTPDEEAAIAATRPRRDALRRSAVIASRTLRPDPTTVTHVPTRTARGHLWTIPVTCPHCAGDCTPTTAGPRIATTSTTTGIAIVCRECGAVNAIRVDLVPIHRPTRTPATAGIPQE